MTDLPSVSPAAARARLRLHGAAAVVLAGGDVALDRRQAALLAWLAAHGPTPRARLAALLWPEVGDERARANLRQSLSRLRRAAGEVLVDERGVLALAADVAIEPLPSGASWLDGNDYADCSELSAWLDEEREGIRSRRRQSLLVEVRAAAQSGALDLALQHADELLALDRESEEAYRALMEVFYLRGDRAAAIAVWDRCRDMLRGLYGVLPSPPTQRLGQTILESAPAAAMPAPTAIPVTVLRPPRLVGRDGVVASLVAAWRAGDALCVGGEAGVGKSRVLAEFVAAVGRCAVAAARPGDSLLPFASLSRLVFAAVERFQPEAADEALAGCVRLLPQLAAALQLPVPEPLRTAYERAQAEHALAAVLDACVAQGCAAFVFDDLHFADRASVETLQALVERGGAPLPARLVLGSRGEELGPAALALLASLQSARCLVQVELGPLGEAGVLELMRSLGLPGFDAERQAPRLRRRVGGNPAFLLESVKLVAALGQLGSTDQPLPVPPGIEAVVERRLALLSPEARHIAELAAIAGESFSAGLAARALARPLAELGEPLRELEWRQVLYGREFVHDIVASAVRRAVPAAVAEMLHRFVAEQLEEEGGEPAVVAEHWRACEQWRRAADSYLAAAARARAAVRPAELVQMLDAAADAYGRCGAPRERFAALRERLAVSTAPDYMPTRRAQLDRLVAEAAGEEERLQALLETVSWHAEHVRSDTLALAEDGLARARALGLDRLAFEFAQPVAWQWAATGDVARALAAIDAQRDWVMAQDELRLQARFYVARSGALALCDRLADALDDSERGLAALRRADDPVQTLTMLANLGLFRSWRGEFAAARAVLAEALQLRDRLHGRGTALIIDLHLGAALRDLGRFADAERRLEAAVAAYRAELVTDGDLLTDLVVGENHLGQLWLALGRPDLAEVALASDDASAELRFRVRRTTLRLRAGRIAGRRDEARIAELRTQTEALPRAFARILAELELSRTEPPARSMAMLQVLAADAVVRERPGLRMHALGLLARAAREAGDLPLARRSVEALLAFPPEVLPFDIDPLEVWHAAHGVAMAAGDAAMAAAAVARATTWLRSLLAPGTFPEGAEPSYRRRHAAARRDMGLEALSISS